MRFQKFNNNPLNKKDGDCVIRAISEGLNLDWLKVYDDLYLIGRDLKIIMSCQKCYMNYLKNYKMIVDKVEKGKKRLKVEDFNKGTYILGCANHLTIVKDGVLKDLWDCRKKAVYRYWIIKGDEVLE